MTVLGADELNKDPFLLFNQWFEEAQQSEINDPDAIALASVDADGMPSVRMVLLKETLPEGFVFYTNYTCLLYTSPSPRDKRQSRMPSSA